MGQYIDFAYIKQNADFAAILKHYNIAYTGRGDELRCRCPFHDDQQPSMTVNLEKRVFHCHAASCGERGNVLEFVAALEETDLRAAAQTIADICDIALAAPRSAKRTKPKPKPERPTAGNRSAQSPQRARAPANTNDKPGENTPLNFQLKLDPEHPYGASRSLSPAVISRFEMGHCGRGSMRGRWCVPIHNDAGELVAYIGRYAADPVPHDEVKYLLPPAFRKELVVFNLHRVAGHSDEVVVVEGVFDVIRLFSLAMPAVGLLGSSISDEQLALLKASGFRGVITLLDAGAIEAEQKLVHQISRELYVRSVALPAGEDPDTVDAGFLRQHVPVFRV